MIGLLGALVLGSTAAFAETNTPPATTDNGGAMMDHQMPKGQVGTMSGMMMNGEMQRKMAHMMHNCSRMMESMMPDKVGAPAKNG
jgi:hypothetical protein